MEEGSRVEQLRVDVQAVVAAVAGAEEVDVAGVVVDQVVGDVAVEFGGFPASRRAVRRTAPPVRRPACVPPST